MRGYKNIQSNGCIFTVRVAFTVILKNLNYGEDRANEYVTDATSQRIDEYIQRIEDVFLNALRKNPKITRKELAKMLKVAAHYTEKYIAVYTSKKIY